MEELVFYNLIYFLVSFFLIYPPQEVQSVGLTLPTLFSSWLGSEELYFVHYHIVRTSLTIIVHSLLPLGYYLYMAFCMPELNLFPLNEAKQIWQIYFMLSLSIALGLSTLVYYW